MKYLLLLLVLLSSCSTLSNPVPLPVAIQKEGLGIVIQKDVENGITIGTAALGATDNLVICYTALDTQLKAIATTGNVNSPDAYAFTDIMRFRIIQQMVQKNASTSQQQCAGFYNEIFMAIVTRGSSLGPTNLPTTLPGLPTTPPIVSLPPISSIGPVIKPVP